MKISTLILVCASTLASSAVNATILALTDNHGGTYYLESYLGDYAGNQQYSLCYVESTGKETNGIVFFDPTYSAFKIAVFENESFYGFSIEGHWTGNESTGYEVRNNGNAFQLTLSISDLTNTDNCAADDT